MRLSSGARKLVLTAHVTSSVGWLGGVVAVLALGVAGLFSRDPQVVRAGYLAMDVLGWIVLVPLSVASLLTGLIQSLGTQWGLFQHYWVLIKLVINVAATGLLLLYMQTLGHLADQAIDAALTDAELLRMRDASPVLHGVGALLLLVFAAVLSIYKPRGRTRYGQRTQRVASPI